MELKKARGERVFVIGDIHGCIRETEALLVHLERKQQLSTRDLVVFLGDYIDRGEDSRQVIEMLLNFRRHFPDTVFLQGNHEDMFLGYLGVGGRLGEVYLQNGGVETIHSYGISVYDYPEVVIEAMPKAHLDFLANLDSVVEIDDFICVHAGLNPNRPLDRQTEEDMFWIRDEFINQNHEFGKTVLFGHTPFKEVLIHMPYKIGLDTGLVYNNKLTCLELTTATVFQVARGATKVKKYPMKKFV
ncbi:MAG: metallophosphoesterase family protein [bacterium]|nr:metallophosphoesterase family protein [bacterium]